MATYSPQDLLKLWKQQEIPLEMTTGHILQNLAAIQETLEAVTRELAQLRSLQLPQPTVSNETHSTTTKQRKVQKH